MTLTGDRAAQHSPLAVRCERAEEFDRELARLVAQPGPTLIEAVV
ncbi:MAG TPA: hypothetical protein VGA44_07380 [Steroidobacteraceae bacterium]